MQNVSKPRKITKRIKNETEHFSRLEHIWWGAKTLAGQKRYDSKLERFKNICKPQKGQKILEIGCGDGEFTKRLVKLNLQVIATDITPKVIEKGKKGLKRNNLKFLLDNAEKMRFSNNCFDIVCGISILHHINPNKTLKEIYRVLKPGGQLFFTEPNLFNPHIYAGLHIGWLRKKMEFSPDETALIRWNISRLLKKIGFQKINVINYDFLHPKTPSSLIGITEKISNFLEKLPLVKEISGSLIVWAKK